MSLLNSALQFTRRHYIRQPYGLPLIHTRAKRSYHEARVLTVDDALAQSGPVLPDYLRPYSHIPRDQRVPIFSHLKDLSLILSGYTTKNLHRIIRDCASRNGGIATLKLLNKEILVVSDPEIAEEICRQENSTPRRYEARAVGLKAMETSRRKNELPLGLLTLERTEWKELRRQLHKRLLQPVEVKKYFDGLNELTDTFISALKKDITMQKGNGTIKVSEYLERFAFEAFSSIAMGKTVGLFGDEHDEMIKGFVTKGVNFFRLSASLSLHWSLPYIFPWRERKINQMTSEIMTEGSNIIQRSMDVIQRATPSEKKEIRFENSLVSHLLQRDGLSKENVIINVVDLMRDSVAGLPIAMAWLLYRLGENPDVQEVLHDEVVQTIAGKSSLDYNTLQQMPYLRACIKEILRLYPPVIASPKVFDYDIQAGGYRIPAYTIIGVSTYNMGRNEDLFEDHASFVPERWLREKDKNSNTRKDTKMPHAFASLPFGQGARSCIGRRVAELEIQLVIANLVKNFKFTYNGPPIKDMMANLLYMEKPLLLSMKERP